MSSRSLRLLALATALAAAAAAVAVALGAFDGGRPATKAEYRATVANARDRVDYALVRITKSQSTDELIERIGEAAAVVDATAGDLDDASVAEGYADLHAKLVDTLQAFSAELSATAAQFQDPAFGSVLEGINSLGFVQWDKVNAILTQMRERGLDVQLLQRH